MSAASAAESASAFESRSSAAPLATPSFDLEQGDGRRPAPEDEIFLRSYFYVYGFSLFIVVVGILVFLFPFSNSSLVESILGSGSLVIGAFLIFNTDLLVTYFRLLQETRRFKENNQQYAACVVQQKARVRELKEIQKALRTCETICHGHLEEFSGELAELHATAQDRVRQNIMGVLAVTRPKRQDIQAGRDLENVLKVFSNGYVHAFPMIDQRFEEMMKGLEASPRWHEVQSMSPNRLKSILTDVFFEDIEDIKDNVQRKVDSNLDAAPEDGNTSAVAKQDSWAEAVAFAGVQQDQQVPEVPKKDSWAEAMEFAGVDR